MMDSADCNVYHAETYEEYHGTHDCPLCGCGAMMDDTLTEDESSPRVRRCIACPYWEEMVEQPDGTIVAVGHVPEEVTP